MQFMETITEMRARWAVLTFYQRFEQVIVFILTALIALTVVFAVWHLALSIFLSVLSNTFDPTQHAVFQAVFGMIFTVIIALEFKRTILVLAERRQSIIQVRSVVLIALLAVVRKLLILDLNETTAFQLLALGATILALGAVYWLVTDQDRRQPTPKEEPVVSAVPGPG